MFTGIENHSIPLNEASELTRKFRGAFIQSPKGEYFGKEGILKVLNQPDCVGVRTYFGLKQILPFPRFANIICGVNSDGNDILEIIIDKGITCPEVCSNPNALNQ